MKQISFFIPLLGTLLLSGCAGTSTEFECNATTSDTCMTMEQANEKAKKLEQSSEAKPVAASLPRLAEGNFRTMPVQTVTATTPSGSRPAVTAHPEQKLLAPRPLFTAAREVKTVVPVIFQEIGIAPSDGFPAAPGQFYLKSTAQRFLPSGKQILRLTL